MKYMSLEPFHTRMGLCLDPADWAREMRRLGPACKGFPFPTSLACVQQFAESDGGGSIYMVVCFGPLFRKESHASRVAIVAHEATHVWRAAMKNIKEEAAGEEIEACGIEWITRWTVEQLQAAKWIRK